MSITLNFVKGSNYLQLFNIQLVVVVMVCISKKNYINKDIFELSCQYVYLHHE